MSRQKAVNFVDACLNGAATLDDVDLWVDEWHESDDPRSLDDYLGLAPDEAALWVEKPETLRFIVAARRSKVPVLDLIERVEKGDYVLAARSSSSGDARSALEWLRRREKI